MARRNPDARRVTFSSIIVECMPKSRFLTDPPETPKSSTALVLGYISQIFGRALKILRLCQTLVPRNARTSTTRAGLAAQSLSKPVLVQLTLCNTGSDQTMLAIGQVHMPKREFIPGQYRADGQDWWFVKSQKTGVCYAVNNGEINFNRYYYGLHEMLRERHPKTLSSGKGRAFSAPSTVRVFGVLLREWRRLGKFPFSCLAFSRVSLGCHLIKRFRVRQGTATSPSRSPIASSSSRPSRSPSQAPNRRSIPKNRCTCTRIRASCAGGSG